MFWIFVWTIFWSLVIIVTAIVRYKIDRFDRLWVPVNRLCTTAVVSTLIGVSALILME